MLLPNYLSIEIQGVPRYTDDGEPFVHRGWYEEQHRISTFISFYL